jgi:hypothetical protein
METLSLSVLFDVKRNTSSANHIIREKLFMAPAFFTVAASFTKTCTICIPCLALSYKGHFGWENKPIIGNMIQQCKQVNAASRDAASYNWVSLGMLGILLCYSFVNYLSLLCQNSYNVTEPLNSIYESHYAVKNSENKQRWFIPWNRNASSQTLHRTNPENPLHHIRTDEQRLALRFLLETASQPVSEQHHSKVSLILNRAGLSCP